MNIKSNNIKTPEAVREKLFHNKRSVANNGISNKKLKIFNKIAKCNSVRDLRHDYNFKFKAAELESNKISDKDKNPNILKKDLSINKKKLQRKKDELTLLKIRCHKLDEENINNKNLLAKILSISPDNITRRKLKIKIDNAKLSKKDRSVLENAHKIIALKSKLFD